VQSLIQELGKFACGEATAEQFRSACRDYVSANPDRRSEAVNWFRNAIAGGRIAAATYDLVADLFAPPIRSAAPVAGGPRTEARTDDFTEIGRPELAPALQAGDVLLGGRYTLVEELGRGGMGQVFKARDRNLERVGNPNPFVALKALNPAFSKDENARSALQSEVMNAKRLAHDNIIRVNDFDWDGPHLIIAMEYLRGHPLEELMRTEYEGGLELERAWNEVIRGVGSALEYAHGKGVVHSDVKPGNVFITHKNVVKVLDFGISRPMAQSASSNETILTGVLPLNGLSVAYASLEQWTDQPADPRDDIYAFALVVYELLTGHHPFANASAKSAYESGLAPQRIESLTRKQWDALRQALAFEREQRTKRVKDLVAALEPPTVYRKYRPWIMGAAALTVAVAVAEGSHLYSDYVTQTMLDNRVRPPPALNAPLTPDQKNEVSSLTGLAEDQLGTVNESSSADDLSYVLSEGANNANDMVEAILQIDAPNERAAAMKVRMAELYLKKANTLAGAGDYRSALTLVAHGRKVLPTSLGLFKMQQHICEHHADLCAALPN
jgi:serine/threonine protein kinase